MKGRACESAKALHRVVTGTKVGRRVGNGAGAGPEQDGKHRRFWNRLRQGWKLEDQEEVGLGAQPRVEVEEVVKEEAGVP